MRLPADCLLAEARSSSILILLLASLALLRLSSIVGHLWPVFVAPPCFVADHLWLAFLSHCLNDGAAMNSQQVSIANIAEDDA